METLQIQTVLYDNDKDSVVRALEALANALRVDRESSQPQISSAVMKYGDASSERTFSEEEISELNQRFGGQLEIAYDFFNENTGTAKGHNRLANDCDSSYVMIMNPDVVVSPKFFTAMFEPFLQDGDEIGLVEARQTPIEHPKYYDPKSGETSWASTAAVIFPYSVFQEVSGFDEKTFFLYCDDVDFSWRIRLSGKKIIYQPKAVAYHTKRLSLSGEWEPTSAEVYYSAEAAMLMAHKWSNEQLLKKLMNEYRNSGIGPCERAVEEFEKRQTDGTLPAPIDPEHTVSEFIDGGYTKHRFAL